MAVLRCTNCGNPLNPWDVRCGRCGQQVVPGGTPVVRRRGLSTGGWLAIGLVSLLVVGGIVTLILFVLPKSKQPAVVTTPPTSTARVSQAASPTRAPTSTRRATAAVAATVIPTETQPPRASNVYVEYILDASASMREPMEGGKTRLEAAKGALSTRLSAMPPSINAGLRAYGHRVPADRQEESCKDTELLVPVQGGRASDIVSKLPGIQAMGMAGMSEAIRQAADDFEYESDRQNSVVLISNGVESCGGDPAAAVRFLRDAGIEFTVHVIALSANEGDRPHLRRMAEVGGGIYVEADNEVELAAGVEEVNKKVAEPLSVSPTQLPTEMPVPRTSTPQPTVPPTLTAEATLPPTPSPQPPTAVPAPVNVTREGTLKASSVYSRDFLPELAMDNDRTTSWFSAGPEPGGGPTEFRWTGKADIPIAKINILNNSQHSVLDFQVRYGFGAVTVQVVDSAGTVTYEEAVLLPGMPDPDIELRPNVVGREVVLLFTGHEAPDCGGISELQVWSR